MARSAVARRMACGSSRSPASPSASVRPDKPEARPGSFSSQQLATHPEECIRQLAGLGQGPAACAAFEIGCLQFQRHDRAGYALGLHLIGDLHAKTPEMFFQRRQIVVIGVESGFRRHALALAFGLYLPRVFATGQTGEVIAHFPVAVGHLLVGTAPDIGQRAQAVPFEFRGEGRAHAVNGANGTGGEKVQCFGLSDHGEAVRLVQIGRGLGEKFVEGKANRDGDADRLENAPLQLQQGERRRAAMQAGRAGEVEKGLVDGERFHQRCDVPHHLANAMTFPGIFRVIRLHHDGIRTGLERLEHRHGRMDAVEPRDIAACRDDTTCLPPYDDGKFLELGIVALLDRREEGIAIDMGDGERVYLRVTKQAVRVAGRTAVPGISQRTQTGATIAGRGIGKGAAHSSGPQSQAAPRTPEPSPWACRTIRVFTTSEKI